MRGDAERIAALADLVGSMARSLDRLEARMNPPRQHLCTAIVIVKKPGGMTDLVACGKLAVVRRDDGKGFYCAEHARALLPTMLKPRGWRSG